MRDPDTAGPLDGVRIVDLSSTFTGPYCTQVLAGMGAAVIKVEPPEGDVVRGVGRGRSPGMGPIFLSVGDGKRSIVLDLKHRDGHAVMLRLMASADVLVTNLRRLALERLGLGWDAVAAALPELVYCSLVGFGSGGRYRDAAAYDDVIQGMSGLAAAQGGDGEPEYVRGSVADKTVGLYAAAALLAALVRRGRTGRGEYVEVPMFEAMASFTVLELQGGHVFEPPLGPTGYTRTASPNRRPYRTADGYLAVMVYTDRQWLQCFRVIGRPELAEDPRFQTIEERTDHIDALYGVLAEALPARASADWLEAFEAAGIAAAPVLSVDDLYTDPHLRESGFWRELQHPTEGELRLPRMPARFSGGDTGAPPPAPRLGADSRAVLTEAGFAPEEIDALIAAGAVREAG